MLDNCSVTLVNKSQETTMKKMKSKSVQAVPTPINAWGFFFLSMLIGRSVGVNPRALHARSVNGVLANDASQSLRLYYANDDQVIVDFHRINDGSIFSVGRDRNEMLMLLTDPLGRVEHSAVITAQSSKQDQLNSITQNQNGDFFFCGTSESLDGNNRQTAFLASAQLVGASPNRTISLTWSMTLGGSNSEQCVKVLTDNNNDIYTVIDSTSFAGPSNEVLVVKLDSEGNQQWKSLFGGAARDHACAADMNAEQSVLCVADSSYSFHSNINSKTPAVTCLKTSDGTILSRVDYDIGGLSECHDISFNSNQNQWIVAGSTTASPANNRDKFLFALDESAGQIQWSVVINQAGTGSIQAVQSLNDGTIIFAGGQSNLPQGPSQSHVLGKLNQTQGLVWMIFQPQFSDAYALQMGDGVITTAGYMRSASAGQRDDDAALFQFSDNGELADCEKYTGNPAVSLSTLTNENNLNNVTAQTARTQTFDLQMEMKNLALSDKPLTVETQCERQQQGMTSQVASLMMQSQASSTDFRRSTMPGTSMQTATTSTLSMLTELTSATSTNALQPTTKFVLTLPTEINPNESSKSTDLSDIDPRPSSSAHTQQPNQSTETTSEPMTPQGKSSDNQGLAGWVIALIVFGIGYVLSAIAAAIAFARQNKEPDIKVGDDTNLSAIPQLSKIDDTGVHAYGGVNEEDDFDEAIKKEGHPGYHQPGVSIGNYASLYGRKGSQSDEEDNNNQSTVQYDSVMGVNRDGVTYDLGIPGGGKPRF